MLITTSAVLTENKACLPAHAPYPHSAILSREKAASALGLISAWPGYATTPLLMLERLARETGVAQLGYKQEAGRFGLGSFKALGGAHAVARLLLREAAAMGHALSADDLLTGAAADVAAGLTVCCATDGNHGRSVAWGAQMFGCRCVILVHETVTQPRIAAIAAYGAEVIRTAGNYDDSVRESARLARENGWHVVSDTSYPGYTEVPTDVMQGYCVMANEAITQMPQPPTHVFLQGGVGGLAAAVAATLWQANEGARPHVIIVEPASADCLRQSALHGAITAVEGDLHTIMAGLACGEPSVIAWPILRDAARGFVAIDDGTAADAMRALATDGIVGGESGVAGLAGYLALDLEQRQALGIDARSRILFIGSEGATDPEVYRAIVGRAAHEVAQSGAQNGTQGAA